MCLVCANDIYNYYFKIFFLQSEIQSNNELKSLISLDNDLNQIFSLLVSSSCLFIKVDVEIMTVFVLLSP